MWPFLIFFPGPAGCLLLTRWLGQDEAGVDRHEELASQTKPVPPKDWRHHGRCSASADMDSEMLAGYESCMQFIASFNLAFFPSARTSLFLCKTKQRNCLCGMQLHTSELMCKIELLTEDSFQTTSHAIPN